MSCSVGVAMMHTKQWLMGFSAVVMLGSCSDNEEPEVASTTQASHAEVSLAGANFEIDTDANLKRDDPAPSIDWASVTEIRKEDAPSGQNDDAFGQGTKEDTAVPTIVSGSIPPQKSDLLDFGVYLETTNNRRFLNLFWHRVQEPNGTTNMDFELNQSSTLSANGVTPVRTAGDLLIQYDLAQGGTHPVLYVSRWVTTGPSSQCNSANATPCWGTKSNLTAAGDATGSINTSAILAADADGLGAISSRTFGEAQIDFDALTGGTANCVSFGTAYLKSRSSDSFTAETKDFVAPEPVNISNCGQVIIRKETDPDGAAGTFTFNHTISSDPADTASFNLQDGGSKTFAHVLQGTGYTVTETLPTGWQLTNIDCNVAGHASTGVTPTINVATGTLTFSIDSASDVLDCTYYNTGKGAIRVSKLRKHAADGSGDHPQAGVSFTVNGVTKTTDAFGYACFDGLAFGSYTVTETVPTGYAGEDPKTVVVDNAATCLDATYAGENVTFHNTPLTNFTVSVDSQIDGGTASTITCGTATASTGTNGDGSLTRSDLVPGTYTCTIVIDP